MRNCKFILWILIIFFSFYVVKAQNAYKLKDTTVLRSIDYLEESEEIYELVEELNKFPDVRGSIVVFGKKGFSLRYLNAVEDFLTNRRGINPERILTSYGGKNEKLRMELWIIPENAAPPQFDSEIKYEKAAIFDRYSLLPEFCDPCENIKKEALTFLADELKKNPELNARIVIFPSKSKDSKIRNLRQAKKEAITEQKILTELGIESSRITTIIGNYDEDGENAELWIIPSDKFPKTVSQSPLKLIEFANLISENKPLEIIYKPKPAYPKPDGGGTICVTGSVTLRVQFLASGKIGEIKPVSTLPYGMTENAIAAARMMKFEPAIKDGRKIKVTKSIVFSFSIY